MYICIILTIVLCVFSGISIYFMFYNKKQDEIDKKNEIYADSLKVKYNKDSFKYIDKNKIMIDSKSYSVYIRQFEKLIDEYAIYKVDEVFGEKFRNMDKINISIDSEDIIKIVGDTGTEIISDMSGTPMLDFLYYYFGRTFIQKHIKNRITAIALNYCKVKKNEISNSFYPVPKDIFANKKNNEVQ